MPDSHSKRVLLSGAEGFSGRYITKELAQRGYEIYALRADITDKNALASELKSAQFSHVIHLAGISFPPQCGNLDVYNVNLFGAQNLLEVLKDTQNKLQKVILASTSNVYGSALTSPIKESTPSDPQSHYALSKYALEQIAKNFKNDFSILIARPFNYTGVGQDDRFLIPKIVAHFKEKREEITLGNLDISRDFSDVRWVCAAYAELLESAHFDDVEIVNICSKKEYSINEIIAFLEQESGHKIKVISDPKLQRKNEIKSLCGDNEKLYRLAPHLAQPTPFLETLSWMLKS